MFGPLNIRKQSGRVAQINPAKRRVSSVPDAVVHCPPHPQPMTPAQARHLALALVTLADAAEGRVDTGPIARQAVLERLDQIEAVIGLLRSQSQDYYTAQRSGQPA